MTPDVTASQPQALAVRSILTAEFESLVPVSLALAILLIASGSSSVPRLVAYAQRARWAGLIAFVGIVVVAAARRRQPTRPPLAPAFALGAFLALALASALWSRSPLLTDERAVSLTVLLGGVAATSWLCAGRRAAIERLVRAIVLATVVVAAAGVELAIVHPLEGFLAGPPLRYRGLGGSPDTASLLQAVVMPLAVLLTLRARGRLRLVAAAALVLLFQTMFLAGSRGSIIAAAGGVLVQLSLYPRPRRWRLKAIALLALIVLYGLFSGSFTQRVVHLKAQGSAAIIPGYTSAPGGPCASAAHQGAGPQPAAGTPLEPAPFPRLSVSTPRAPLAVLGLFLPRTSTLFDGSGRLEAWRAAIRLGDRRPVLGHGFGTEQQAFLPEACRLQQVFSGGFVENSYLGLYLQLGGVGLGLLLLALLAVLRTGIGALRRARGRERELSAALLGAVVAGLLHGIVQSYFYSAGNIATLAFWTCAGLLLAMAADRPAARSAPPRLPLFISADVAVVAGERAEALLRETNDARYLSPEQGIVRVDRDRWREAQRYEETTWLTLQRGAADDRNEEHRASFDGYAALAGRSFENVIELGCGPFTNLRLMLDRFSAGSIHLLDPLAEHYLEHPHCAYRDGRLNGRQVVLHPAAIEDFQPPTSYDLVVVINVIEHCLDAQAVLDTVLAMLRPEGLLVFHDKLYTAEAVRPDRLYDAGHPLRVRGEVIERFLRDHFDARLERRGYDSTNGVPTLYFIGSRRHEGASP